LPGRQRGLPRSVGSSRVRRGIGREAILTE
jgi:hypothetical protein